jgi:hypothetical protein
VGDRKVTYQWRAKQEQEKPKMKLYQAVSICSNMVSSIIDGKTRVHQESA